jgi:hypothetical protein
MKDSALYDAGSWVGTWAAAIAIEADNALVVNNTIVNTYCGICTENGPLNVTIANNTIIRSLKGIDLNSISGSPIVIGNKVFHTAMHGIDSWDMNSIIVNNTVTNAWGAGIVLCGGGQDQSSITGNKYFNVKGPAEFLIASPLDLRQILPVSLNYSNVMAGDYIEIALRIKNRSQFMSFLEASPYTFFTNLTLNGKTVDTNVVTLQVNESQRILLKAVAQASGTYNVTQIALPFYNPPPTPSPTVVNPPPTNSPSSQPPSNQPNQTPTQTSPKPTNGQSTPNPSPPIPELSFIIVIVFLVFTLVMVVMSKKSVYKAIM